MITLEYFSNNSGGDWWLSDEDWYNLEAAGWTVAWVKDDDKSIYWSNNGRSNNGRWLGALARECKKQFESVEEGVREWEQITGQNAGEMGCNCCGQPHNFSWTDEQYNHHFVHVDFPSCGTLNFEE